MELTSLTECDVTSVIIANGHSINVEVYPNPTHGYITVKFSEEINVQGQIIVVDILGKIVNVTPINIQQTRVTLDTPPGVYFILYQGDEGSWGLIDKVSKH